MDFWHEIIVGRMKGKPTRGRKRIQMLHNLANDGGFVALKRAAEDREVWRHRERMSKPAVQQKTTDDDDLCPTDSEVKSSVDIGDCFSAEIVEEFCYLGDVLSVDGDVDAAMTARIHSG